MAWNSVVIVDIKHPYEAKADGPGTELKTTNRPAKGAIAKVFMRK
jgi:hypothetical protein